mgnify:CR=1 FL=1
MSIFKDLIKEEENEKKDSGYGFTISTKPFKTVTAEYFEALDSQKDRRVRVVTTTRVYGSGSSKGDPVVSVSYEYL